MKIGLCGPEGEKMSRECNRMSHRGLITGPLATLAIKERLVVHDVEMITRLWLKVPVTIDLPSRCARKFPRNS